jgi:hypothetical protein
LQLGVNSATLAVLNVRPADYLFQVGEWVIFPNPQPTP